MLNGLEDEAVRLISEYMDNNKGEDSTLSDLTEGQKSELLDFLQWELGVVLDDEAYNNLLYGQIGIDYILNAFYEGTPIQ